MWVNPLQSAAPACAAAFAADAPVTATSARLRVLRVCGCFARCGLWGEHLVSFNTARSDTWRESRGGEPLLGKRLECRAGL